MKIRAAIVKETAAPFVIEVLELDSLRSDEILVKISGPASVIPI